jgi:hypothetical protein
MNSKVYQTTKRSLLIGISLFFFYAAMLHSATINVTGTSDTFTGGDKVCTLREAISNINDAADTYQDCVPTGSYGSNDTINIQAGTYNITRSGSNEDFNEWGDFDLNSDTELVISGAGPVSTIINGNNVDRVFHIISPSGVTIENLSVIGGASPTRGGGVFSDQNNAQITLNNLDIHNNTASEYGGGVYIEDADLTIDSCSISSNTTLYGGGGVFSIGGLLVITNSTIDSNSANSSPGTGSGGGIYNWGSGTIDKTSITNNLVGYYGAGIFNQGSGGVNINITNSTISNNNATGGDYNYGGGLYNGSVAVATIINSIISNNSALNEGNTGRGGGIFNGGDNANLTILNTTISGNTANTGGGIASYGSITASSSTVSNNEACPAGGGIYILAGTADITNVTVSNNIATCSVGAFGAGVLLQEGSTAYIKSSTIAFNNSELSSGAGLFGSGATTHDILNTIISDNFPDNCYGVYSKNGSPTTTNPAGYNISSDESCYFSLSGDQPNVDPLIGPLADNGGLTFTHALQPGSPALDAADPVNYPAVDQRGITRPQGTWSDIGAYELTVALPAYRFKGFYPPVNNTNWNLLYGGAKLPLRWRLLDANFKQPIIDPNTIVSTSYTPISCSTHQPSSSPVNALGYLNSSAAIKRTKEFVFTWQTPKLSNACVSFDLLLNDGQSHSARFYFIKRR